MRRHARTHGTLLTSSADDENGHHFQSGSANGGPIPSRIATGHFQTSAGASGREASELGHRWQGSANEVDELEDEEDDEMDTDGGGGSSESDGYPPNKSLGRLAPTRASMNIGESPCSPTILRFVLRHWLNMTCSRSRLTTFPKAV
jgi:hypothetical protein